MPRNTRTHVHCKNCGWELKWWEAKRVSRLCDDCIEELEYTFTKESLADERAALEQAGLIERDDLVDE